PRRGIPFEIGNPDAEGRLILADALTLADEEKPAMIVDFATLTGAARVALGPDIPPFFTDDDALADALARAGSTENDPVWRMPLWRPYRAMLDSKVTDLNNVGAGGHGRGVSAALIVSTPVRLSQIMGAPRYFRLDAGGKTRPPGRRRVPDGASPVRDALQALRLSHGRARSSHQSVSARDRRETSAGSGRGKTVCRGQTSPGDRAERGAATRALARRKARYGGTARRARHDLRNDR